MRLRLGAFLISCAALTSGCSILPESEPPTLYRLPSPEATSDQRSAPELAAWRLGIAAPEAGYLLRSNRIVVHPERNVVNVYEGARWQDDTPELLAAYLIDHLQRRELFAGVSSDQLPTDLLLLSELRHFQSDYQDGLPHAMIQLDVQLLDNRERTPIASHSFRTSHPADDVAIPAVVDAFGEASDALAEQLSRWLIEQAPAIIERQASETP